MSSLEKYPESDAFWHDEYAVEKAERLNCDIVYGDDHTLTVDLDTPEARESFHSRLGFLEGIGVLPPFNILNSWHSKSGVNKHVQLWFERPIGSAEERILLQALLGSDLKREALNLAGVRVGRRNPILLFKPRGGVR
jgi:hypothetical protein